MVEHSHKKEASEHPHKKEASRAASEVDEHSHKKEAASHYVPEHSALEHSAPQPEKKNSVFVDENDLRIIYDAAKHLAEEVLVNNPQAKTRTGQILGIVGPMLVKKEE